MISLVLLNSLAEKMCTQKEKIGTNSYKYETHCKKIHCSFDAKILIKLAGYLNIVFTQSHSKGWF